MKRLLLFLTGFILLFSNVVVGAEELPVVKISMEGEFKQGETIKINIDVDDIKRFYGGQVEFTYDTSLLKVTSLELGQFIKDNPANLFDVGSSLDKNGNVAMHAFTYTGSNPGLEGSGRIWEIEAEVLKDGYMILNNENMLIKLIDKYAEYDVRYADFKQKNINLGKVPEGEVPENEDGNNVDENGNRVDEDGNKVDENGNRVDENGNRVDENGNRVDEDGNRVDKDGNKLDANGNPIKSNEGDESKTVMSVKKTVGIGALVVGILGVAAVCYYFITKKNSEDK